MFIRPIALISGGVDSVLVTAARKDAVPLFIDYGQPEVKQERAAVEWLWPQALTASVSSPIINRSDVYFPARNLLLATTAVACFGATEVLMGGMGDDNCVDKTPAAFEAMSAILSAQALREIKVTSPFWDKSKADAITDYLAAGGDAARLLATFSCYTPRPNGLPCGDCPACFRRTCALRANDLTAPNFSERVFDDYLRRLHEYPPARRWTMLHAWRAQNGSVVAVDIDGVLAEETTVRNYAKAAPIKEQIDKLNQLTGKIILHSARRECDRVTTTIWLREHGVKYHALILDKLPVELYCDDHSCLRLP